MTWLGSYVKRIPITIDNTNVDSDLNHFPVAVPIGASVGQASDDISEIFDDITTNYKKIAVTLDDGETQIYVEVEKWDYATETALLWVSSSDLTVSSGSTTTLYIYFDNSQPDNDSYIGDIGDSPAQNVWDSDFSFVCHMANDPSSGMGALKDSTGSNDGDAYNMESADLVTSDLGGYGINFDGSPEYISVGDAAGVRAANECTLETLFNLDSVSGNNLVVSKNLGAGGTQLLLRIDDGKLDSSIYGPDYLYFSSDMGTWSASIDYYCAMILEGASGHSVYQNGYLLSSGATWSESRAPGGDLNIGRDNRNQDYINGRVFEIRLSHIVRSEAWVKATHYCLIDDLVSFGTTETNYIEDVSLNLTAATYSLEDLKTFLTTTDGTVLTDVLLQLAAFADSTEDIKLNLEAGLENLEDLPLSLETWGQLFQDLPLSLEAQAVNLEDLKTWFRAVATVLKDLGLYLNVTDGVSLEDLSVMLNVTDGIILRDASLNLKTVSATPAFRSVTAHRVSSVIHEVV